jgi:hypothetical protein
VTVRLRATHLLLAGPDDRRPPDAVARSVDDDRAFFVPGWLPCGECGQCRRGWVAACPRGRSSVNGRDSALELPERFLTALDEPVGVAPLAPEQAACAGVVAECQELAARAGLGGGDLTVWIGDDARCSLGARLTAARGLTTFRIGGAGVALREKIVALDPAGDPRGWNEELTAAASGAPGGFQERRLFVAQAAPGLLAAAAALIAPGTTVTILDGRGGGSLDLAALAPGRMILGVGRGYHPDLVPEALAALRRDASLTADLVGTDASPSALRFALVALS